MSRRTKFTKWTPYEKQTLLNLIHQKKDILLENKPNRTKQNAKSKAWLEIFDEMRAKFGDRFSENEVRCIKNKWRQIKEKALQEVAASRMKDSNSVSKESLDVCEMINMTMQALNQKENDRDYELPPDAMIRIKEEVIDLQSSPATASEEPMETETRENEEETLKNATEQNLGANRTEENLNENLEESTARCSNFEEMGAKIRVDILMNERSTAKALYETAEINKMIAMEQLKRLLERNTERMASGEMGSGAGKGGGGGGAIRDAGGAFGKMEAAHEDQYFYNQQKQQLEDLKKGLNSEIHFHEEQIKRHQEAIERHKNRVTELDKH